MVSPTYKVAVTYFLRWNISTCHKKLDQKKLEMIKLGSQKNKL